MLRMLKRRAMAFGERLVALVMLPAFLLGTLPQTVCICAAGEGPSACPTNCCGERDARCAPVASGGHCCSPKAGSAEPSCCRPQQLAENAAHDSEQTCGACCHQILAPPSPAIGGNESSTKSGQAWGLVIDVWPLPFTPAAAQKFSARNSASVLPPLDLVILLRRLTI